MDQLSRMSSVCGICTQNIAKKTAGIQCDSCRYQFHRRCAGLLCALPAEKCEMADQGIIWRCKGCRSQTSSSVSLGNNDHSDLQTALLEIKNEIKMMRAKQDSLVESVQFCSSKVTEFESKLDVLNTYVKKTDRLENENKELRKNISTLDEKLNELDQYSRLNNLELQGIPDKEGENILNIFESICLSLECGPLNVEYIHRIPTRDERKSKPIVVRFLSRCDRDKLLAAYKANKNTVRPGLTVDGVANALYINEHLTQTNKILFKETRQTAKEKSYKFVWVKNGNIFARKNETTKIQHIKNMDSIKRM